MAIATVINQGFFPLITGFYALSMIAWLSRRRSLQFAFLVLGFLGHTIFLVNRMGLIGIWSPYALFEESFFLPWCLAALALGLRLFPGRPLSRAGC